MTQRERHASGSVSAVAAAPTALAEGVAHAAPRAGHGADRAASRVMLWEDFYRSISPDQQHELLALAGRQGLLYAHQLPASSNGSRTQSADALAGPQRILAHLFDDQGKGLDAVRPAPVNVRDRDLDAVQREAVARALSTPDFCLIQGLPGTGKSRVAAEIIVQAAIRGERVLLLAPGPAALDRILEMLADCEDVCPVRCLGADEKAEELPSLIRGFVFAEKVRTLRDQSVLCARQGREQAEQTCRHRQQESGLWSRLLELAECWQQVEEQRALLRDQHARIAEQVRQEAAAESPGREPPADSPFAVALATWRKARQETLAAIDAALDGARRGQTGGCETVKHLENQAEPLRGLVVARQQGRWWSPARWRALFKGDIVGKLAALESQLENARAKLGERELEIQRLMAKRLTAEQAAQTQLAQLVESETRTRQDALIAQEQVLIQEAALLQSKWDNLCQALEVPADRPTARSPAAVQAAQRIWQAHTRYDEERCTFARQWSAYLEQAAEDVATRLPDYTNLVAATTASLAADPHFGDAAAARQSFDLLILEEATYVTESEFLPLARRAARWVLIGQPAIDGESTALPPKLVPGKVPRSGGTTVAGLGALQARFFQRLWQHLHADPSHLPCAWVQEGERVCCRLRNVPSEQRRWVESERVADFPDIELRILTLPRLEPVLAEVVFPATMSIHEAKQYLYRELQEFPVQTSGRSLTWIEDPERLTLRLARTAAAEALPVPLENGVQEWVDRASANRSGEGRPTAVWHTCRIEFARSAGWERRAAETWVRDHLHMCDLGRTALLETPQRMTAALAAVVWDLLFDELLPWDPVGAAPAFEFVAVPPLLSGKGPRSGRETMRRTTHHPPRTTHHGVSILPRSGAGLELDLAAPRQGDRLPSELRARLPRQGFVNYLEAQVVVRRLEALAAGRSESIGGIIAVIALYPAQVELIRRLLQQSTLLRKAPIPIAVDLPGAFAQRECPLVLVSLTRSHAHRAVSFGDSPRALSLALTRARSRLILFGDPGACLCRSQWQGAVDHLDDAAAAREAQIFARLMRYLQGQGRQQRAFHLSEGSSA